MRQVIVRSTAWCSRSMFRPSMTSNAKNGYLRGGIFVYFKYLTQKAAVRSLTDNGGMDARISEIYRLCYEAAKDGTVITDFAAFHPELAIAASWLAKTVRQEARSPWEYSQALGQNRLLRALAKGFDRASRGSTRRKRRLRAERLQAARSYRTRTQRDLEEFFRATDLAGLDSEGAQDRSRKLVREKVDEIVRQNPEILGPRREVLSHLLGNRHGYEASVLIASVVFGVASRKLETAPFG